MDTMSKGANAAANTSSVANSMMQGVMKSMDSSSDLVMKMQTLLKTEEHRKVQEQLQTQQLIQNQFQFGVQQQFRDRQLESQETRAAARIAMQGANLNESIKQHKDSNKLSNRRIDISNRAQVLNETKYNDTQADEVAGKKIMADFAEGNYATPKDRFDAIMNIMASGNKYASGMIKPMVSLENARISNEANQLKLSEVKRENDDNLMLNGIPPLTPPGSVATKATNTPVVSAQSPKYNNTESPLLQDIKKSGVIEARKQDLMSKRMSSDSGRAKQTAMIKELDKQQEKLFGKTGISGIVEMGMKYIKEKNTKPEMVAEVLADYFKSNNLPKSVSDGAMTVINDKMKEIKAERDKGIQAQLSFDANNKEMDNALASDDSSVVNENLRSLLGRVPELWTLLEPAMEQTDDGGASTPFDAGWFGMADNESLTKNVFDLLKKNKKFSPYMANAWKKYKVKNPPASRKNIDDIADFMRDGLFMEDNALFEKELTSRFGNN